MRRDVLHGAYLSYSRHPRTLKVILGQSSKPWLDAQGKIKHLSKYDPLDLFSGEPQRVEAALAALFAEPQNNLKLFLDGSPMQLPQDDRLSSLEMLPVVQQAGGVRGLIRLLRIILLREGRLHFFYFCSAHS